MDHNVELDITFKNKIIKNMYLCFFFSCQKEYPCITLIKKHILTKFYQPS